MMGLPRSVAAALEAVTYSQRALAYLQVDAELKVVGAAGNLENYGLGAVRLGEPALGHAFFLEGLLPPPETPYFLPSLELGGGRAADLHFFRDGECVWVVLLDVTAERDQTRRIQQKAYEMTLLQEKEALLNRSLEAVNAALRATQRELETSQEALIRRSRELSDAVEELRALGEVSQAVNSTIDLETVLTTIVAKATQLSKTEAGAIYVFDDAGQEFQLHATFGLDDAVVAKIKDRHIHIGESAIGQAAKEGRPIQIPDVQKDPSSLVLDVIVRAGFRALLIVPLLATERIVGALVVRRKQPGEFSNSTVDLLQTFAAQSVLAIQNARLFVAVEEKSQQLEIASKHKSQFLANMSHELRTPLNAIIGFSEIMESGMFGPLGAEKYHEYCSDIRGSGQFLLEVINDILDMSKIEAGRIRLDFEDLRLDTLLNEAMRVVAARAQDKQLELSARISPGLRLRADRRALKQIVLNLLSNAVKFTPAGGRITVRGRTTDRCITLAIADSGIGIAKDALTKLGRPFEQVESQLTKSHQGSGLGLAISKSLVELHGGRMRIRSTLGKGTLVVVRLPLEPQCLLPKDEAA
jgi:signal transduction histidine kinase